MSRSYKKHYCIKDTSPFSKRQANKKVRRNKNISDGSNYKKVYNSYNICDWAFYFNSKDEADWFSEGRSYKFKGK